MVRARQRLRGCGDREPVGFVLKRGHETCIAACTETRGERQQWVWEEASAVVPVLRVVDVRKSHLPELLERSAIGVRNAAQ